MTGVQRFRPPIPLILESGGVIEDVEVAYRTWGRLDAARTNAVIVCHALTGGPEVDAWWPALLGPGRALDPDREFILCSNILGSCYGTTGPTSRDGSGRRLGARFPDITVRDMVSLQRLLLRHLGVQRVSLAIGGSLGGMQVLEWAVAAPDLVEAIVPIAAPGRHSAWAIALSEAQRKAIESDPRWRGGDYEDDAPPARGLAVARMIAMASYRSHASLDTRFARSERDGSFAVSSWLRHHGDALARRFDANSYLALTRAMDSHDLGRGRSAYEDIVRAIDQPALVVSIDSDLLYPPVEQEELALLMPNAVLETLPSRHGHDAFLIEGEALNEIVVDWRAQLSAGGKRPLAPSKPRAAALPSPATPLELPKRPSITK